MGRGASWPHPFCSPRPKRRSFEAGSIVEIRSNDEGFMGAWFEAVVTRSGVTRSRRYAVAYTTLLADDGSGSPLRELVHASFIRPQPPPDDSNGAFELHQCVEAFHNDGWWKGVVCRLLGDGGENSSGTYGVYFPMTREEAQFKASELRRHMEWVKGKWVPVEAQSKKVEHLMFAEGSHVEVSRDREKYGAAWFVGTVLKVIGKTNFLVEYENLRAGSDNCSDALLKEIVDVQYIRPCPPATETTSFGVLDEVEGFHNNGWYAGVVSVILPGPKYVVTYKHEEGMVLDHTSVRRRFEWINGHWVYSSQGKHGKAGTSNGAKSVVRRKKSNSRRRSTYPISVSTSGDDDDDGTAISSSLILKRKKRPDQEDKIEPSQVSKKPKGELLTENQQLTNDVSNDESSGHSIPVPTSEDDDGEMPDTPDVGNLKGKVESGAELSQTIKKTKKGNLLGKRLQLQDEIKSVSRKRRTHSGKRSGLGSPVLTPTNIDGLVTDLFGVGNLKDKMVEEPSLTGKSSQPCEKSEKGKSLEEHLQSVGGTLMDCGYKTPVMVGKCSTTAEMLMIESNPDFISQKHHSSSPSHESIAPNCKAGPDSQSTALSRELCYEQGLSGVNGTNESIIMGKESCCSMKESELQSKEANFDRLPVERVATEIVENANGENDKGDPSTTENTRMRRKMVVRRTPKRQEKIPEVDVEQHAQEEMEEEDAGIPPKKKITFINSMESEELKGRPELVGGWDNRDLVEPSNHLPTLDVSFSSQPLSQHGRTGGSKGTLPTITTEGNDDSSFSDKQAVIMGGANVTPRVESKFIEAGYFECSAVQQSSSLKYFLSRGEQTLNCARTLAEARAEACPQAHLSMEDCSHDHREPSPDGLGNTEKDRAPIAPTDTGSSSEEDNVCDDREFSPSRLLSEKAFVEAEDKALLDPSPCRSSVSRDGDDSGPSALTSCRSLSVRRVEMEQTPCHPQPCGSEPCNDDIRDRDELSPNALPARICSSFVHKAAEIHDSFNELGENGRESGNKFSVGPRDHSAQMHDDSASLGPQTGIDIFKDGETGFFDSMPMELLSRKSLSPFLKQSEFWESVESTQVFRALPQQPHFHPLVQYRKEFREGMAIGLMVTFATLVRDVSKLCIVDSQQDFAEKLRALHPLEMNGFNVQPIRDRIEKLLELRHQMCQSQRNKHSLGAKVQELEEENEKSNLLMFSIRKVISEMEQRLSHLRKKQGDLMLEIRKNDSEIVDLKAAVKEAEVVGTSAERLFSAAVTAPW